MSRRSRWRSASSATYKDLANDVKVGNMLLLDDGKLVLKVTEIAGHQIKCEVLIGGILSNSKGINLQGGGLSAAALTKKDQEDLKHGVKIGADYFAVSFARKAEDILEARRLLEAEDCSASIIAKFKREPNHWIMQSPLLKSQTQS